MTSVARYGFIFAFGAAAYAYLEMLARGRTHWTMLLAGGTAMLILYGVHKTMQPVGRLFRCLIGCVMITGLEFLLGLLLNRRLGLCVWDYSGVPLNVLGLICPKYSALWFLLCLPGDALCGMIEARWTRGQLCSK